ncbi:hypothetical protein M9H77_23518 [Catharanthus roseus]|uniref:Uncharacterized protein n=1 Tax=Catharanthus roseus TaxID=4058 RepID=A0ACC0ATK6_CATRO|nr:hypothetical protein M9H77_23518 [Catharanthus roseus]
MSSPVSRQKEASKTCAQKKVGFEGQLREIGVMSNKHIGKKISIGEPSGPWSKKSEIEESARTQEVMLDKNDTCEGKESHERMERVEESEGISVEHYFLDAIPSLLEKVERDESEILEERKEGTMKEKESLFKENERINEENGSESAKERHDKSSYSLELKLDSLLKFSRKEEENWGEGVENKEERMLGESIMVLESENKWGEFLEKAVFDEVCRKFFDLENFVTTFPRLKCEVEKPLKHGEYSSLSLKFFWKMYFNCHYLSGEEFVRISKAICQHQEFEIFLFYHLQFKECCLK